MPKVLPQVPFVRGKIDTSATEERDCPFSVREMLGIVRTLPTTGWGASVDAIIRNFTLRLWAIQICKSIAAMMFAYHVCTIWFAF